MSPKDFFAALDSPGSVFKDKRAQAALTDSLFFLAIVTTICTSLFFFAINYGLQMEQQINSFYASDFANDALKVVTYVNVLRTGQSVYLAEGEGADEYDYLLALIKEDYAGQSGPFTRQLGPETRLAIASTLDSVLKPFQDSIDYSFFLANEDQEKFLFLLLATHRCEGGPENCQMETTLDQFGNVTVVDSGEGMPVERVYYYCQPKDTTVLQRQIFPYVGQVDTSIGKITLFDADAAADSQGTPFMMGLNVWVSKDLQLITDLSDPASAASSDFNCSAIDINP